MFSFNFHDNGCDDASESLELDDLSRIEIGASSERLVVSEAAICRPRMEPLTISCQDSTFFVTLMRSVPPPSLPGVREDTDLLSGIYEGGLKIWECSLDLIRYMLARNHLYDAHSLSGTRVLELGCGHGLPGIFVLLRGAHVIFSDFNREVLELVTIPNVLANSPNALRYESHYPSFYFGDWSSLLYKLQNDGHCAFDLILTADTLYTESSGKQIYKLLLNLLAPTGHALVATKRYYFGCGGGSEFFKELVNSDKAKKLYCETDCVINSGASNIREIIRVGCLF